jgi:hypothetical protein
MQSPGFSFRSASGDRNDELLVVVAGAPTLRSSTYVMLAGHRRDAHLVGAVSLVVGLAQC